MNELLSGYKGRGIVVGECAEGAFFAYFISGRSGNSQNRIFVKDGADVKILPHRAELVEDPRLIIYHPVRRVAGGWVVTNGDQTDTVAGFLAGADGANSNLAGAGAGANADNAGAEADFATQKKLFAAALQTREFEPDAPNFTPRISAICAGAGFAMSILKERGGACERLFWDYGWQRGRGRFICTYSGGVKGADGAGANSNLASADGANAAQNNGASGANPAGAGGLESFVGEPREVECAGTLAQIARQIWDGLDPRYRISLYARTLAGGEIIINKNC